jgi:hypothetical protein
MRWAGAVTPVPGGAESDKPRRRSEAPRRSRRGPPCAASIFEYGPRPSPGPRSGRRRGGCIAQLVEQLTLNQRVVGSSPTAPTMCFGGLGGPVTLSSVSR